MKVARYHILVVLTAAIILCAAGNASASSAVSVVNESTGTACPAIAANHLSGGCQIQLAGQMTLRIDLGIFGEVHEATCSAPWVVIIGVVAGVLTIVYTVVELVRLVTNDDNNCGGTSSVAVACDMPWEGTAERDSAHTLGAVAAMCLNPSESSTDCTGNLAYNVVESEGTEALTFVFNNASVGLCELDMDLAVTSGNVHLN